MPKIRLGNDFTYVWAIERDGSPEDLTSILNGILILTSNFSRIELPYTILDTNKLVIELNSTNVKLCADYVLTFSYEITDTSFSDDDRLCTVDIAAFTIVKDSELADDSSEFTVTSDMAIGFKGDKGDKGDPGASAIVRQTLGTSTEDVISQNAASTLLLTKAAQTLTSAEQLQVRINTGTETELNTLRYFKFNSIFTPKLGYLSSTGSYLPSTTRYNSDFIKIEDNTKSISVNAVYAVGSQANTYAAIYDENKNLLLILTGTVGINLNILIENILSTYKYILVVLPTTSEFAGEITVTQNILNTQKILDHENSIINLNEAVTPIENAINLIATPKNFPILSDLIVNQSDLVNGQWLVGLSDPENAFNTTRIAIKLPIESISSSSVSVVIDPAYNYNYALIDDNGVCQVVGGAWLSSGNFNTGVYSHFSLHFKKVSGAAISPSDIATMGLSVSYTKNETVLILSDKTISESTPNIFSLQNSFNIESNLLYKKAAILANIESDRDPLIIIAGQSNADGREYKANAPDWLVSDAYKIPRYKMWNRITNQFEDYEVGVNDGSYGDTTDRFSFDVYFAHQYLIDNPTKTLYAIRQTVGGVPITEKGTGTSSNRFYRWQPKTELISSGEKSMCTELLTKISYAKSYAYVNGIKLLPIAILFHQGEGDADRVADDGVIDYPQNLKNLTSWFRGLFLTPTLPFLNAYVMNNYNANYATINTIFEDINNLDEYSKTVDMTGHYTSIGDNLHYNAAALDFMGNRMYENYKSLNI